MFLTPSTMAHFEMETSLLAVGLFFFIVLGARFVKQRLSPFHDLPYLPGSKPKFFTGNTHNIPVTKPWITYADWGKQYGMSLSFLDSPHT